MEDAAGGRNGGIAGGRPAMVNRCATVELVLPLLLLFHLSGETSEELHIKCKVVNILFKWSQMYPDSTDLFKYDYLHNG
jgi:hypothetical protein